MITVILLHWLQSGSSELLDLPIVARPQAVIACASNNKILANAWTRASAAQLDVETRFERRARGRGDGGGDQIFRMPPAAKPTLVQASLDISSMLPETTVLRER